MFLILVPIHVRREVGIMRGNKYGRAPKGRARWMDWPTPKRSVTRPEERPCH